MNTCEQPDREKLGADLKENRLEPVGEMVTNYTGEGATKLSSRLQSVLQKCIM